MLQVSHDCPTHKIPQKPIISLCLKNISDYRRIYNSVESKKKPQAVNNRWLRLSGSNTDHPHRANICSSPKNSTWHTLNSLSEMTWVAVIYQTPCSQHVGPGKDVDTVQHVCQAIICLLVRRIFEKIHYRSFVRDISSKAEFCLTWWGHKESWCKQTR